MFAFHLEYLIKNQYQYDNIKDYEPLDQHCIVRRTSSLEGPIIVPREKYIPSEKLTQLKITPQKVVPSKKQEKL